MKIYNPNRLRHPSTHNLPWIQYPEIIREPPSTEYGCLVLVDSFDTMVKYNGMGHATIAFYSDGCIVEAPDFDLNNDIQRIYTIIFKDGHVETTTRLSHAIYIINREPGNLDSFYDKSKLSVVK